MSRQSPGTPTLEEGWLYKGGGLTSQKVGQTPGRVPGPEGLGFEPGVPNGVTLLPWAPAAVSLGLSALLGRHLAASGAPFLH